MEAVSSLCTTARLPPEFAHKVDSRTIREQCRPNTRQKQLAPRTRKQGEPSRTGTSRNLQNLHPRFKSGRRLQIPSVNLQSRLRALAGARPRLFSNVLGFRFGPASVTPQVSEDLALLNRRDRESSNQQDLRHSVGTRARVARADSGAARVHARARCTTADVRGGVQCGDRCAVSGDQCAMSWARAQNDEDEREHDGETGHINVLPLASSRNRCVHPGSSRD